MTGRPGLQLPPAPVAPARAPLRLRWPTVLLLAGLAVQLAPLLLPLVLTQDGPAHVDGAWVLLHHGDDSPLGELLRRHYAVDLSPVPNMLTTLLLALLLTVLSADAAEKVVVAGFVLLLVAGLRYALRGVDRRAGWLAVAALPLAGGQLVAYGFYNFCWGVALSLFVLGLALRRRTGWPVASTCGLALLLVLTWSAHLLPWLMAAVVLGGLAGARSVAAVRSGVPPVRAAARHLIAPSLALLPTVALSAGYVLRGDSEPGSPAGGPSWARVAWLLTQYRPLAVGSWLELAPALVVATVLGWLGLTALRRRPAGPIARSVAPVPPSAGRTAPDADPAGVRSDRLVLGSAALLAAAVLLLCPARLGEDYGFLPDRLSWFPPLLLVLFSATRPPDRAALRRAAAAALVLAATALVIVRLPTQLRDQRDAAELMSVAADIPPGATFAVLRFSGHAAALAPLPGGPDPLRHLSSRLAVRAQGVDVGHYEGIYPYFQVRFTDGAALRHALDPGLDGLDAVPPWVHLPAVAGQLDYVVVVGLDRAQGWVRHAERTTRVLADLRAGYDEVARSGPSGYVTVWRLRNSPGG